MSLRVGLMLVNRAPVLGIGSAADLVELGVDAEAAGWDSVWVGDSLLAKPRLDAIVLLSALAARTSRVLLGPACMASTPLRPPLLLAHQWASLDALADGRTVFVACQGGGPGSGEFAREFANLGIEPASRMRRLEEALEILRATWSTDDVSYEGEYTRFEGVTLRPRLREQIPIWVAANPSMDKPRNVASAYRRVARYADGWQTTHTTPEDIARSWELIHGYADELGRPLSDDFELCVCSNICVAPSREQALEECKRFLDRHSMTDYAPEFLAKWAAMGPAEECIRYLERFVAAGASTLLLRLASFDQRGQFELVTRDVLPQLQGTAVLRH